MKKNGLEPFQHFGRRNEILLKMKLTFILLLAGLLQVSAVSSYSQSTKLSLEVRGEQVSDVLRKIEDMSDFRFFYQREQVDVERSVSFKVEDEKIMDILNLLFAEEEVQYNVYADKLILLAPQEILNEANAALEAEYKLQPQTISGTITDVNGEPIIGANIYVQGTSHGTITNLDGQYTLTVDNPDAILVYSYVGFISQEQSVTGQTTIDIIMASSTEELDEVVVIGYGTQQKSELTSAVVQLDGDVLVKTPTVNLANSLQGQLAGLNIRQTASSPGFSNPVINIRGANTFRNNAALIVIDGVASADFEGLDRLNPQDIATISVLKDASAAIYGIQSSGGVIVVTTKRGQLGKPTVTLTTSSAFQTPTRLPQLADAVSFMNALNAKEVLDGLTPTYSDDEIAEFTSGSRTSTDWNEEYLDTPVYMGRYDITVSGGLPKVKYFLSAGVAGQNSALVNDSKFYNDQNNIRSNLDINLFKGLEMSVDFSVRSKSTQTNTYGTDAGLGLAVNMNPTAEAFIDGDINHPTNGDAYWSPVAVSLSEGFQRWDSKVFSGKVNLKYLIPKTGGLYISTFMSRIYTSSVRKTLITPYYYYGKDLITDELQKIESILAGTWTYGVKDYFEQNTRTTFHAQIGYDHVFNEAHSVSTFAAYQDMTLNLSNFNAGRSKYNTYAIPELFAGVEDTDYYSNDGSSNQHATQTFFGRASYDYMKKYLISVNFRADGSPIFAPENRWGYFPGVAAGWVISKEEFMSGNTFSHLKLRASWGMLGNDRVAPYQYLAAYGIVNGVVINNESTQGINQLYTPNPEITWEVSTSLDIGLEMSFLKNRLFIELDYFDILTENILAKKNFSVPGYTGLVLPDQNIGTMKNKGFELQIGFQDRIKKFSYSISGNVALNQNEITFFDEIPHTDPAVAAYQNLTGNPFGSPLVLHATGIYKTDDEAQEGATYSQARAGFLKYEDKNGDGEINSNDMYRKGINPEIMYGLQLQANYAGFDLSLYFNGRHGDSWQFGNDFYVTQGNNLQYSAVNSFTLDRTDAELPKSGENSVGLASDFNMLTKSWFRLKTVNLGYTLSNNRFLSNLYISQLRIYASADNFLMLYNNMEKYGAVDPELNSVIGGYPMMSTYNFGVIVTF
jgi:TonB-linked SusC/RagA family outer membrane protein